LIKNSRGAKGHIAILKLLALGIFVRPLSLRHTLLKDFKNIDPTLARTILIEASPQILPYFSEKLSVRATRDLESLGVQVKTFQ
jgi:hypothetical protein